MTALWSSEQQAWLKALGHRVMVLAGDELAVEEIASVAERVAGASPAQAREAQAGYASERAAVSTATPASRGGTGGTKAPPSADVITAGAGPARRPPPLAGPADALERALLGATGQRTRSEARAMLADLGVDVAALRGDAAAKRALWQKLRPLRPKFRT